MMEVMMQGVHYKIVEGSKYHVHVLQSKNQEQKNSLGLHEVLRKHEAAHEQLCVGMGTWGKKADGAG